MSIIDEPKIDCHNHILDPARFSYQTNTPYRPAGHEIAPVADRPVGHGSVHARGSQAPSPSITVR